MQIDIRNDNLSLVNSINAATSITQEKRLAATLTPLREMLHRNEINSIGFIAGTTNLADGLTKATSGNDIQYLLAENTRATPSRDEKKNKLWAAAADKQYLFPNNDFIEEKKEMAKLAKQQLK